MRTRVAAAMLTLISLMALMLSGCGRQTITSPWQALRTAALGSHASSSDTVPPPPPDTVPPPPPPPPPPTTLTVAFTGSDSTQAGTTGQLRWTIGNTRPGMLHVSWSLTGPAWPGMPKLGSINVPGRGDAPLAIAVAVPANVADGRVPFLLTATARRAGSASADGFLGVFTNNPPPPPPVSPLVYLGADSVRAGGTVHQRWQLTNESASPFVMQWTLESHSSWAGLPQNGSVSLAGNEVQVLTTSAAVPDTVQPGVRFLRLTVTRPDTLPNASADGGFQVLP